MEFTTMSNFYQNKSILVLGGAGFLAKIFAEKVLRSQPKVKKVYLLLRAEDDKAASLRLQNEVIGMDLFDVLKQKMGENFNSFISGKITVVRGDVTWEDLAIEDLKLKEKLWSEVDIIVNLAANIKFDERYDVSLSLNTFGAKNVLDFDKKCTNLKVLVHVSTAYVSGETAGLVKEVPYDIGESLNGRPGLDVQVENFLVEDKLKELHGQGASKDTIELTMRDFALKRAGHWGWPNVYVLTKALGEMLVMQEKQDIPLVFIRPTIVTSTFKEPFPGWIEGIRTIDSIVVGYGKGRVPCIPGNPNSVVDLIPADMVVNAMLVAAMTHANDKGNLAIYHVGSSVKNAVTFKTLFDLAYQYFKHHPWIQNNGTPVIVRHVKILTSMSIFNAYFTLYYLLPLKVLEIVNMVLCQYFKGKCMYLRKNIYHMKRMFHIYEAYLFFKGLYDDINTENLRIVSRERGAETETFYFDPKDIDWNDYFMNTHLPGILKYGLKR